MPSLRQLALAVSVCALLLAVSPSGSQTATPPNPSDPCARTGRDVCGTTGVGFYKQYRYGLRWFGDYRGAIPGVAHTYCLDLGFWYPSAAQRYEQDASPLRNRDGAPVPVVKQEELAYAIWAYGRTTDPNEAAAVMLYVHALMGDARPGEVDPGAVGATVARHFSTIARDAARYHGPYRVKVELPGRLDVGAQGTASIRVLSGAGQPLPDVGLTLTASGAAGVPTQVRTSAAGVATVRLTGASASGVKLTARTEPLASTLPTVFTGTTPAARRNGQRLAVPASQTVDGAEVASGGRAQVVVSSTATPPVVAAGQPSRDRVAIRAAEPAYDGTVSVRIHGPARTVGALRCDREPAWRSSFHARGAGVYTTPPATLTKPGWYVYQELVPDDPAHAGATTPCTEPSERVRVEVQPRLETAARSTRTAAGTSITDRILVQGLAGEDVTIRAALFGPFASRDEISCSGQPVWSGSVAAHGDGEYTTEAFTVRTPGYYTYQESIEATEFVRAARSACAETAETAVVRARPQVTTRVSALETRPGAQIHDTVVVSGLGALAAAVRVELFGPAPTRAALACTGAPSWTGTLLVKGDGTYATPPFTVARAGYYTYRESIAASEATTASTTPCGEQAETTFARATPSVTTLASAQVVRAGSSIFDRIRTTGLGATAAAVQVELFGPFSSRAAMRCTGRPYWSGRLTARGDGELRSPAVRVRRAGFYTFRERVVGSPLVAAATTACAVAAETSLSAPAITTGRNEVTRYVPAAGVGASTPRRVQIPSVGIDAPVSPVGIDTVQGELGVPPQISRTGWWQDGAAPGARSGAILIAGHVDSARAGAGAFFRLHEAKPGDRVRVSTAGGRVFAYRVTSVRLYPKPALPTSIYARNGPARLVVVTCGGPFAPELRHYRDNVVLTAVPA